MSNKKLHLVNLSNRKAQGTSGDKLSYYTEKFKGLPTQKKREIAALMASDNGRCWWVYEYLLHNW